MIRSARRASKTPAYLGHAKGRRLPPCWTMRRRSRSPHVCSCGPATNPRAGKGSRMLSDLSRRCPPLRRRSLMTLVPAPESSPASTARPAAAPAQTVVEAEPAGRSSMRLVPRKAPLSKAPSTNT